MNHIQFIARFIFNSAAIVGKQENKIRLFHYSNFHYDFIISLCIFVYLFLKISLGK